MRRSGSSLCEHDFQVITDAIIARRKGVAKQRWTVGRVPRSGAVAYPDGTSVCWLEPLSLGFLKIDWLHRIAGGALMSRIYPTCLMLLLLFTVTAVGYDDGDRPGYRDTPLIPGQKWRVHDSERPWPTVVDPGAGSLPVPPPADAVVLLGNGDLLAWTSGGKEARWANVDGAMEARPGSGNITSRESFGDMQLHVEFRTPPEVKGSSQGRGNSGVFLMNRYELQVLDSYQNPTYPDGQCAAFYGQWPPMVNACRGPGQWQSYDIMFIAPRFAGDGALLSPARATVVHNGVLVHNNRKFLGPTSHRSKPSYSKHSEVAPISLQDHGNPIRYRNIWVRRLDAGEEKDSQ